MMDPGTRLRRSGWWLIACAVIPLLGCGGGPTEVTRELVPSLIAGFEDGDPDVTVEVTGRSLDITVVTSR